MKVALYLALSSLPFLMAAGELLNEIAYVVQRLGCSPGEQCQQVRIIDTSMVRHVPVIRDIQLR